GDGREDAGSGHFLGVTAVGMQGTASVSEVIPAAGEAGEPGPIGTLGKGGVASPVRHPACS
ncbi:hypothetical protein, partial [Stappia sp. TSB10P1A]|uniref:hypothetical protein n=1 Tax=Stappia sp. TSB10P1A TaxID=2003585 RepID=UPI001AD93ACC